VQAVAPVAHFQMPRHPGRASWEHNLAAKSSTRMEDWDVVMLRSVIDSVSAQALPGSTGHSAAEPGFVPVAVADDNGNSAEGLVCSHQGARSGIVA